MKLLEFLRRLLAAAPQTSQSASSPGSAAAANPNATSPRPEIDPALAGMISNPKLLVDPVFPKDRYLHAFGTAAFQQILRQVNAPGAVGRIRVSTDNRQMTALTADGFGFWAIDLEATSDRGTTGRDEFVSRVRDPIRRPPPQLAAVAVEQHIIERGVVRIQINDGPSLVGGAQICSLKTVGWYAASLVIPKARQTVP